MNIRRRFGNYDDNKNENAAVVPFVLPDESDPDALLPAQLDRSGILRPPPNVGPQGPQGKGRGGDEDRDGRKGNGCLNRICIGRSDIPTNEGVQHQGGEGGYGEEDMRKEMHLRDRYGRDEEERRQRPASVVVYPSIKGGDRNNDGGEGSGGRGTTRVEANHVAPTLPLLLSSASRDGTGKTRPADEE